MNLIDLVKRRDRALAVVPDALRTDHLARGGTKMAGLHWPAGTTLRIDGFREFDGWRGLPRDPGWRLTPVAPGLLQRPRDATFRARAVGRDGEALPLAEIALGRDDAARWTEVRFDWTPALLALEAPALELEVAGAAGAALFVGVAEAVDLRGPLLALARGTGIEIGPGMNPQVRPGPGTDVRYLEKLPAGEWRDLYQKGGQRPAESDPIWRHYVVGDAQRLDDVADGSLDFLFSSHVFEHFVNPLGTLQVWRDRLRPGGHVLGVVPDANCCFDLRQPLSREQDWRAEQAAGTWACERHHYEKWCRYTEPRVTVASLVERDYSIHAHYYTPATFAALLRLACDELGYRAFHIGAVRNHKDFVFALRR